MASLGITGTHIHQESLMFTFRLFNALTLANQHTPADPIIPLLDWRYFHVKKKKTDCTLAICGGRIK